MADAMVGPDIDTNWTDKRQVQGAAATQIGTPANYGSVTAMKARLTAISGTSYTAARLNTMTVNDLIYAIRLNDDTAGI
jgi:hypothetical protein